jgi:acyl carrier protein
MKILNDFQKTKVKETLAIKLGFEVEKILDETDLRNDLGTDSIDDVGLIMEFEKIFNCDIPDSLVKNVKTVSDIYYCLAHCL